MADITDKPEFDNNLVNVLHIFLLNLSELIFSGSKINIKPVPK